MTKERSEDSFVCKLISNRCRLSLFSIYFVHKILFLKSGSHQAIKTRVVPIGCFNVSILWSKIDGCWISSDRIESSHGLIHSDNQWKTGMSHRLENSVANFTISLTLHIY